ncbi:hypothetical protein Taro_056981, partial [Colocasia esculenta]|nr:hypothetical protein [Colocasia esculenta]
VYRWCHLRRCCDRLVPPVVVLVELCELVLPRGMSQVVALFTWTYNNVLGQLYIVVYRYEHMYFLVSYTIVVVFYILTGHFCEISLARLRSDHERQTWIWSLIGHKYLVPLQLVSEHGPVRI